MKEDVWETVGGGRRTCSPCAASRSYVAYETAVEREQPGPAIRPLEAAGVGPIKIIEFARDLLRRQHLVGQGFDPLRHRKVWEA